jgi:hypothetical protein
MENTVIIFVLKFLDSPLHRNYYIRKKQFYVVLKNFQKWLKGLFICEKCRREFFSMGFGFGASICPDCYDSEQPFMIFDESYWLNRITSIIFNHRAHSLGTPDGARSKYSQIFTSIENK